MIDYDTSTLPTGSLAMSRLLDALYAANEHDENEWIEFKAGLDPTSPEGRAGLAKAIVAFANRDPARAARWLGGHALVVIGLEPGNAHGVAPIDPAKLHDAVAPLLAPPAPHWDITPMTYRDVNVLVITISPPQEGDPIFAIGKATGKLQDGNIYVRQPGKSAPATSAEIRRLSDRLMSGQQPSLALSVGLEVDGGLARCDWRDGWIDEWLGAEERRLIDPLEAHLNPPPPPSTPLYAYEPPAALIAARAAMHQLSALAGTEEPEDRQPDSYRAEVEKYLGTCRERLEEFEISDVAARSLPSAVWTVTNLGPHNLENVQVRLHIEGEVEAFEVVDSEFAVRSNMPKAPRVWGPRKKMGFAEQLSRAQASMYPGLSMPSMPLPFMPRGGPIVENGGSVAIQFEEVHLRPHVTEVLDASYVLVVAPSHPGPMRCTWSATATNVSGVVEDAFEVPLLGASWRLPWEQGRDDA